MPSTDTLELEIEQLQAQINALYQRQQYLASALTALLQGNLTGIGSCQAFLLLINPDVPINVANFQIN